LTPASHAAQALGCLRLAAKETSPRVAALHLAVAGGHVSALREADPEHVQLPALERRLRELAGEQLPLDGVRP
jgi:hypothetical protein